MPNLKLMFNLNFFKKMEKNKEVLVSLNSEFTEFDLQSLEKRLETDPLAVGGFLNLATTDDPSNGVMLTDCECNILSHND